jgi:hypothetical protein
MLKPSNESAAVFARADECSGSNYTCNGCGNKWGDHVSPGSQCPGNELSQTATESAQSQDLKALSIEKFVIDAWNAHASGETVIQPLSKTLKAIVVGAESDCFPLYGSAIRVGGRGVATYRLCMTNGGSNFATVLSAVDFDGEEIIKPTIVVFNKREALLPAVRKFMYCASRAGDLANDDGVYEDRTSRQRGPRP